MEKINNHWRFLKSFLLFLSILGVAYQLIVWRSFSVEVTWIQVKDIVFGLDNDDLKSYGSICNSLERYGCSEKVFEQMAQRFPRNSLGLANLAIVLAKQGKWQPANAAFEKYFKLGGRAYDAMFWFGKTLNHLNQSEKALAWFYRSLALKSGDSEIAIELVDHLVNMGRFEESLSVIAAFTEGDPERDPYWQAKIEGIEKYLEQRKTSETEVADVTELRFPALSGKAHFVPVKTGDKASYQFFLVDQKENETSITEEILAQLYAENGEHEMGKKYQQALALGRLNVPEIQIGPWKIHDLEVVICKACQPRLGRSILTKVNLQFEQESQTEFLLLSRR